MKSKRTKQMEALERKKKFFLSVYGTPESIINQSYAFNAASEIRNLENKLKIQGTDRFFAVDQQKEAPWAFETHADQIARAVEQIKAMDWGDTEVDRSSYLSPEDREYIERQRYDSEDYSSSILNSASKQLDG